MSVDSAHSSMNRRLPVYLPIRANSKDQRQLHLSEHGKFYGTNKHGDENR
jgi:hypothetical protein